MKASRLSCLVRSTIAHAPQRRFVVRPPAADLDPDLEINLAAEKLLHVETRGSGNLFQLAPARSYDDRLVSLSSHHDSGVNPPYAALVLEFLDLHAGAIGSSSPRRRNSFSRRNSAARNRSFLSVRSSAE